MTVRNLFVAVALAFLMGCVAAPAIIADLESDKVIVQSGLGTKPEAIKAKANEGCEIHGKTPEGPLSMRCLDQYCLSARHLFACK